MRNYLLALIVAALPSVGFSQASTTVRISDKVLVAQTERMGVHFGGHNYYDSVILKQRVAENFEGTIARVHIIAPEKQPDPGALHSFNSVGEEAQDKWVGADYTITSGPEFGRRGKVTGFAKIADAKKGQAANIIKLDKPARWSTGYNGLLLERSNLQAGQNPWIGKDGKLDDRWISPQNQVVQGDVPPGSFGCSALLLKAGDKPGFVQFRTQFNYAAAVEGQWKLRFWAKARSPKATLKVSPTMKGESFEPAVTDQWQKFEKVLKIAKPEDSKGLLWFAFKADGDVLIDDVEIWQEEGDKNPTPFRDTLVDALKELQPGSMRYLRNTRNTLLNSLMPAIRTYSMGGSRRDDFGTHEFFELCEYLKCGAWATLPGTLQPDEIDQFMEYVGAPADVGLGKLRAELGHPEPWTRTLPAIYVQFGNEAVTFTGTGYWGPDYWQSMIEKAKKSPYYSPKVVFTVNEQGPGAARVMDFHPAADRLCINSYLIFGVYDEQLKMAKDLAGFYDFVFASSWHMWHSPENNKCVPAANAAKQRNKEICIYEGANYHTTFGTLPDPPVDQVNRMITGHAGGLSATHNTLVLLKAYGARTVESFNLAQTSFSPGGGFGNMPKPVRVWGGILNVGKPEQRRFRPRFLALQVANHVMGGDLVETVHSGADPKITVTNLFGTGYGPSRKPTKQTITMPAVCSYAFVEGNRRGLILVSQDTRNSQEVVLECAGQAAGGKANTWLLASEDLEANNETDWNPDGAKVKVVEQAIDIFKSGQKLTLPKASMLAVEWQAE